MSGLKPYICPQCGGQVDRARLICKSCGTQFKEDGPGPLNVVYLRPGVHVLRSSREVGKEICDVMGYEKASEFIIRHMAEEMAQNIIPFMDIMTIDHPERNAFETHARLRVLEPTFEF